MADDQLGSSTGGALMVWLKFLGLLALLLVFGLIVFMLRRAL